MLYNLLYIRCVEGVSPSNVAKILVRYQSGVLDGNCRGNRGNLCRETIRVHLHANQPLSDRSIKWFPHLRHLFNFRKLKLHMLWKWQKKKKVVPLPPRVTGSPRSNRFGQNDIYHHPKSQIHVASDLIHFGWVVPSTSGPFHQVL